MTDKLPEFVEQWIEENTLFGCIDAELVRAFLAKFVLCDREPVGHVAPSSDGDAIVMTVAALRVPLDATTPLHAPATEVPGSNTC